MEPRVPNKEQRLKNELMFITRGKYWKKREKKLTLHNLSLPNASGPINRIFRASKMGRLSQKFPPFTVSSTHWD